MPSRTSVSRPRLISRDTDATVRHADFDDLSPLQGPPAPSIADVSALTVVWSNEPWLQLTQGRSLDGVLDQFVQHRLSAWVEAEDGDAEPVFTLPLKDPAMILYLTKTTIPNSPPTSSHTFCIITSQTRPHGTNDTTPLERPGVLAQHTSSSRVSFVGSHRTDRTSVSTDSVSLGNDRSSISTGSSSAPSGSPPDGYFPQIEHEGGAYQIRSYRDPPPSMQHLAGAAEEHWRLLNSFDWARTKLGPKELWLETVGAVLSSAFHSKTLDCIWLGEDLHLI